MKLSVDEWALKSMRLETADGTIPDVLIANEGDAKGRGINLSVLQGGLVADMTGMSVYLAWGHENGSQGLTEFSAVDAASGKWKLYYPEAMQCRGTVVARILVYVGGTAPITGSRDFRIFVEKSPIDEDAAITSDDFSVFAQAVVDLHNALSEFGRDAEAALLEQSRAYDAAEKLRQDAFEAAESARSDAEGKRKDAEAERARDESARKTAETARAGAESSRVSAETSRANAESSRASAEGTRKTAETARASAESARESAEGTRKSSETARQTAETARAKAETARETAQAKNNADQAQNNAAILKLTPYICAEGEYDTSTFVPTIEGEPNRMYFVPNSLGPGNVYIEWMLIKGEWEMMGVSNIEISPITTAQIDAVAADQAPTGEDTLNLTGLSYVWAKIKAAFAPKSHAAASTTYGVSSASNYGHAKASQTTPLANGAAALGDETASFARGDHRHPLQTTVAKLATARAIRATGDATGSVKFDGSTDVSLPLALSAGCVGQAELEAALLKRITDLEAAWDSVSQQLGNVKQIDIGSNAIGNTSGTVTTMRIDFARTMPTSSIWIWIQPNDREDLYHLWPTNISTTGFTLNSYCDSPWGVGFSWLAIAV